MTLHFLPKICQKNQNDEKPLKGNDLIFVFFKENSLRHLKIGKKWIAIKRHQFKLFKRAVFKYPFPFEVSSITIL